MAKLILIIDDEEAVRKSFVLALEDEGYDVDTVSSGEEGVRAVKKRQPDLIFLDLKMPGMNGVDTLKEIREIDTKVPVYVITAFLKEFLDLLNAAVKQGVQFEVLNKPIESQQIRALVKGTLEKSLEY